MIVLALERLHRHREAALGGALATQLDHLFGLPDRVLVKRVQLVQLGLVSRLAETADGLADLADRAAFEREAVQLDDRLVAQVDRAQPELLVQRAQLLAGAERAELEAAGVGELADLLEQAGERVTRSDGVAREQQDPVLDRVGHERPPVLVEDVVAVGPQLEERERVGAVGTHEIGSGLAGRRTRRRVRNRERPEDHVGDHQQGPELEHVDADRDVVVEVDRARLVAQ